MNTHALKVGVYLVLLYIACLLWRFTMTDPAVVSFHLLSLKSVFPGFSGYNALSILWGAVLSFAYGYIGSLIFHSLHSECCVSKNNGKKEEKISLNTTNLMWVVGALVVGVAIGLLLARQSVPSKDYFNNSAFMMRDGGSSMMQFGEMMQNGGRMMQERGGKYNDQEMMQQGRDMMERGEQFRKDGSDIRERGNGMMNMMR